MMRVAGFIIILATILPSAAAAGDLCPTPAALPPGADDLRLSVSGFTRERYESALEYLDHTLPAILHDSENLAAAVNPSVFWISYRNSITFIRGYVLLQRAEHARDPEAKAAAVTEFCSFLSGAA